MTCEDDDKVSDMKKYVGQCVRLICWTPPDLENLLKLIINYLNPY